MTDQHILAPLKAALVEEVAVGVAIKEIIENRRHVGLVYDLDGEARFLHLAWHQKVIDEPCPDGDSYLGAGLGLDLDKSAQIALAGFLNTVESSVGLVPYGIDFETAITAIQPDATLADLPLGKGMTCATFVAAVLNAARYMPIKPETWIGEKQEDIDWHNWVIEMMENTGVDPAHIQKVKEDVGCKRLRPEQIVSACTCSPWPVAHESADAIAAKVISDIASLAPSQ